MLVLSTGDKIKGSASVASEVDYMIHGLINTALSPIANGQLPATIGDLYTAPSTDVVTTLIITNTGAATRTINLSLLRSEGTARLIIPKDLQLPAGCSLYFDGSKSTVLDTAGTVKTSIIVVDGDVSDGDKGDITVSGTGTVWSITNLASGQLPFPATQNPSDDPNTLDDYEENGTWTMDLRDGEDVLFGTATGHYVKIGQLVTVTGEVAANDTNAVGAMSIYPLPYFSLYRGAASVSAVELGTGHPDGVQGIVEGNKLYLIDADGSISGYIINGSTFYVTATYLADDELA